MPVGVYFIASLIAAPGRVCRRHYSIGRLRSQTRLTLFNAECLLKLELAGC